MLATTLDIQDGMGKLWLLPIKTGGSLLPTPTATPQAAKVYVDGLDSGVSMDFTCIKPTVFAPVVQGATPVYYSSHTSEYLMTIQMSPKSPLEIVLTTQSQTGYQCFQSYVSGVDYEVSCKYLPSVSKVTFPLDFTLRYMYFTSTTLIPTMPFSPPTPTIATTKVSSTRTLSTSLGIPDWTEWPLSFDYLATFQKDTNTLIMRDSTAAILTAMNGLSLVKGNITSATYHYNSAMPASSTLSIIALDTANPTLDTYPGQALAPSTHSNIENMKSKISYVGTDSIVPQIFEMTATITNYDRLIQSTPTGFSRVSANLIAPSPYPRGIVAGNRTSLTFRRGYLINPWTNTTVKAYARFPNSAAPVASTMFERMGGPQDLEPPFLQSIKIKPLINQRYRLEIIAGDTISGIDYISFANPPMILDKRDLYLGDRNLGVYVKTVDTSSITTPIDQLFQGLTLFDLSSNQRVIRGRFPYSSNFSVIPSINSQGNYFNPIFPNSAQTNQHYTSGSGLSLSNFTMFELDKASIDTIADAVNVTLLMKVSMSTRWRPGVRLYPASPFTPPITSYGAYDNVTGLFKVPFVVPKGTIPGRLQYYLVGWTKELYCMHFSDRFPKSVLTITSLEGDEMGPTITAVSSSFSANRIVWTLTVEDAPNGVANIYVQVSGSLDPLPYYINLTASDRISGTAQLGLYQVPIDIAPSSPSQTFRIEWIRTVDTGGAALEYGTGVSSTLMISTLGANAYQLLSYDFVSSSPIADTTAPVLESLSLSLTNIDYNTIRAQFINITVIFTVLETGSGLSTRHTPILYLDTISDYLEFPMTQFNSSTFSTVITVPFGFGIEYGIILSLYGLVDNNLNHMGYTSNDLATAGFTSSIDTKIATFPLASSYTPLTQESTSITVFSPSFRQLETPNPSGVFARIYVNPPIDVPANSITDDQAIFNYKPPPTDFTLALMIDGYFSRNLSMSVNLLVCFPPCQNGGVCDGASRCICTGHWSGPDCSFSIVPSNHTFDHGAPTVTLTADFGHEKNDFVSLVAGSISITSIAEIDQSNTLINEYHMTQWDRIDISDTTSNYTATFVLKDDIMIVQFFVKSVHAQSPQGLQTMMICSALGCTNDRNLIVTSAATKCDLTLYVGTNLSVQVVSVSVPSYYNTTEMLWTTLDLQDGMGKLWLLPSNTSGSLFPTPMVTQQAAKVFVDGVDSGVSMDFTCIKPTVYAPVVQGATPMYYSSHTSEYLMTIQVSPKSPLEIVLAAQGQTGHQCFQSYVSGVDYEVSCKYLPYVLNFTLDFTLRYMLWSTWTFSTSLGIPDWTEWPLSFDYLATFQKDANTLIMREDTAHFSAMNGLSLVKGNTTSATYHYNSAQLNSTLSIVALDASKSILDNYPGQSWEPSTHGNIENMKSKISYVGTDSIVPQIFEMTATITNYDRLIQSTPTGFSRVSANLIAPSPYPRGIVAGNRTSLTFRRGYLINPWTNTTVKAYARFPNSAASVASTMFERMGGPQDLEPPFLQSIKIKPLINQRYRLEIIAGDTISGIDYISFANPPMILDKRDLYLGDRNLGVYVKTVDTSSITTPIDQLFQGLTLFDLSSNQRVIRGQFPYSSAFSVIPSINSQGSGLSLSNFTMFELDKVSIDTFSEAVNVMLFIKVNMSSDWRPGVRLYPASPFTAPITSYGAYDNVTGLFKVPFVVPKGTIPGRLQYYLVGWAKELYCMHFSDRFPRSVLNITSMEGDEMGPTITAVSSSFSANRIVWTLTVEDAPNGVANIYVQVSGSLDPLPYYINLTVADRFNGTAQLGLYQVPIDIAPSSPSQTFRIEWIRTVDTGGAALEYGTGVSSTLMISTLGANAYDLLSYDFNFSSPIADTTAPVLESLSLSLTNIDYNTIRAEFINITVGFTVLETGSGLSTRHTPILYLDTTADYLEFPMIRGANSSTFSTVITVPFGFGADYGIILSLYGLVDNNLNHMGYTSNDLAAAGFTSRIDTEIGQLPLVSSYTPLTQESTAITVFSPSFSQLEFTNTSSVFARIYVNPPIDVPANSIADGQAIFNYKPPPTDFTLALMIDGYFSRNLSLTVSLLCFPPCQNGGVCDGASRCICTGHWSGPDCSFNIVPNTTHTFGQRAPTLTLTANVGQEKNDSVSVVSGSISITSIAEIDQFNTLINEYNLTQWDRIDISDTTSNYTATFDTPKDSDLSWIALNVDGNTLYGRFYSQAISDGRDTTVTTVLVNNSTDVSPGSSATSRALIGINVGSYLDHVVLDPDLSLLIDPLHSKPSCDPKPRGLLTLHIIIIVISCGFVSIVVAVTIIAIKKKYKWSIIIFMRERIYQPINEIQIKLVDMVDYDDEF
eukprot:gene3484-3979_t